MRRASIRYSVGAWQRTLTPSASAKSSRSAGSKRPSWITAAAPVSQGARKTLRADFDQPVAVVHQARSPRARAEPVLGLDPLAEQVAVGVDDAARVAGRARGEDDQRRVLGRPCRRPRRGSPAAGPRRARRRSRPSSSSAPRRAARRAAAPRRRRAPGSRRRPAAPGPCAAAACCRAAPPRPSASRRAASAPTRSGSRPASSPRRRASPRAPRTPPRAPPRWRSVRRSASPAARASASTATIPSREAGDRSIRTSQIVRRGPIDRYHRSAARDQQRLVLATHEHRDTQRRRCAKSCLRSHRVARAALTDSVSSQPGRPHFRCRRAENPR